MTTPRDSAPGGPETTLAGGGERWSAIPGSERCAVSDRGRVAALDTRRLLWQYENPAGSLEVRVRIEGVPQVLPVHVLVAVAFVPNPRGRPLVRHLDGEPQHNSAGNLAWGSEEDVANDEVRATWLTRMDEVARLGADARSFLEPWERLRLIRLAPEVYRPSLSDPWPEPS